MKGGKKKLPGLLSPSLSFSFIPLFRSPLLGSSPGHPPFSSASIGSKKGQKKGPRRELNPGPLLASYRMFLPPTAAGQAILLLNRTTLLFPERRIIPLDHAADRNAFSGLYVQQVCEFFWGGIGSFPLFFSLPMPTFRFCCHSFLCQAPPSLFVARSLPLSQSCRALSRRAPTLALQQQQQQRRRQH